MSFTFMNLLGTGVPTDDILVSIYNLLVLFFYWDLLKFIIRDVLYRVVRRKRGVM